MYIIFGGFYDGKDTVGAESIIDIVDDSEGLTYAIACAADYIKTHQWLHIYDTKTQGIEWRWDYEENS